MARSPLKIAGAITIGVGLVGLGAVAGVRLAGRRIRRRSHPETDPLLRPPEDVTHRTVRSADGAEIHVVERGEGRPILLLHGVTLQWWVWGAQFNTLSERYRVLAWDMRGHGRSTVGDEGMTLEAIADDLAAVLEELDLRDAIVVGHSMGGMALGRFCARHEDVMVERCAGLMFLDTSAAPLALPVLEASTRMQEVVRRAAHAGTARPRVRYAWPDTDLSLLLVRATFGRDPSIVAIEDMRTMLAEMDHDNLVAAARAIVDHDVREDLSHVKVPAMVVVGSADLLTPVGGSKVLSDAMPGSALHVLGGVGHQSMQETPERFAQLVDELAAMSS